jgi:hypothetical protein
MNWIIIIIIIIIIIMSSSSSNSCDINDIISVMKTSGLFNDVFNYKYEDILVTLHFLTLHSRRDVDTLYFTDILTEKFVAHLFWILLVCACSLRQSETTARSKPRSVLEPDVTADTAGRRRIDIFSNFVLCLLISASFFNEHFCFRCFYFLVLTVLVSILLLAFNPLKPKLV